ncbi:Site-specific DNA recombinase [Salipaludibacillus aurantiacus]|uniref:Site-specific DNA recombinase n=2 Tax=Salipaludibacillus aurantiacus TaxID=1601833 RepID=A0A1H9ULZ5_9BACI|nr:Site-specific DNA recombinase [Salipaludibacillus aurantiacus]
MSYRVGAFVRVSTDRLEQHSSLENQRELIEEYIEEKGWSLKKLYIGPESGTKLNSSMKELLEDIENKRIDILLVKDLFRLARNAELSHRVKNEADKNGIHIVTLNNLVNTMEGNDRWYGLYSMFAQMESENTSEKIKFIFKKKMAQGKFINSTPPYGYRIEDQKLYIREDDTPKVVRRIYHDYLNGASPKAIADKLTTEGVPTPAQVNNRKNAGLKWQENTVRGMLLNRHYIGTVVQGRTTTISITTTKRKQLSEEDQYIVEDVHEPIISKELFNMVQDSMLKRKRNHTVSKKQIFSNLCFCADCGTGMWYRKNRKGYICGKHADQGNKGCKSHLIKEASLLNIIKSDFQAFTSSIDKAVIKKELHKKIANHLRQYEQEINKVKASIEVRNNRKVEFLTLYVEKQMDQESCTAAIDKAKEEINIFEKELEKLQNGQEQNNIDQQNLERDFVDFLFAGQTAMEIVHRIIDKIEVQEDGTPKIYYSFEEPSEQRINTAS